MKLLLCSWAPNRNEKLEKTFLDLLSKPPNENKALILLMDTTSEFFVQQLDILKTWYMQKGFQENNIKICNLKTDKIPSLDEIDILHMGGGNEFHYMYYIREKGLLEEIHEFITRDGVYVGSSAGSVIMSSELDENLSPDSNDVGLTDLSGFGYIDFNFLVHWDVMYSGLHADWLRYSWEHGRRVVCLTDQQAVLVLDDGFNIISP